MAIVFTVLGFNLLGDGLRDAADPQLRGEDKIEVAVYKRPPLCRAGPSVNAMLSSAKPVKPVRYFLQAANAVFGLAAAAQFVVFSPPEHAEPSLNAVVPERCKHLQGFRQPAAVILFRMDKQGWGLHPIRVLQRRMFPQFGRIGPGVAPPI